MKIEIDPRVFNPVYYPHLFTDSEYFICYGGSGSGKSFAITQKIIIDIMQGGRNYLVIRKVSRTIRNSVFALFQKIITEWDLQKLFTFNKSEYSITCVNGYKIICQGLDDPEKIKSITATKGIITDVWIEEATELLETDLNQLILRLRGKTDLKKRVILTFNPISETHWIKTRFYNTEQKNVNILKTTYLDNLKNLSQDDIEKIESLKITDPLYYQIYALGEWGQINNNDTVFKLENILEIFEKRLQEKAGQKVCGIDVARMGLDSSVMYLRQGEIVLKKLKLKKMDSVEVVNEIEKFVNFDKTVQFNIDAGMGQGVIDVLKHRGYQNINEVHFGGTPKNSRYSNKITEMWFETMKISKEIQINFEDKELKDELLSRKYWFDELKSKIFIEPKESFKKSFGRSPDSADAFLLCFWNGQTEKIGSEYFKVETIKQDIFR